MIGYNLRLADLEKLIEAHTPGWLKRAAERTEVFRANGRYSEKSSIWSEVKAVYMQLQGRSKCAYCERKLESSVLGKGEQDVEHFRPKGRVKPWKAPNALSKQGINFTAAQAVKHGYYLLPYHPFNYSAACKPCNSALKRDYFPIAGKYDLAGDDPAKLTTEMPLLICPIGDFDDPPEELIRFHGISPQAAVAQGYGRDRALVTIEFFKLDSEAKRKNLIRERAMVIVALFPQLERTSDGAAGPARRKAQALVDGFTAVASPHTNCARCFRDLFQQDRVMAEEIFELASKLIATIS